MKVKSPGAAGKASAFLQCVCVSPGQGFGAGADSFPPVGCCRRRVTMTSLVRLQVQLARQFKEKVIYFDKKINKVYRYTLLRSVSSHGVKL